MLLPVIRVNLYRYSGQIRLGEAHVNEIVAKTMYRILLDNVWITHARQANTKIATPASAFLFAGG